MNSVKTDTSNKCIATSNRCLTSSNKEAIRNKCIATSNRCLTSSNKKLIETSALLLVTIRIRSDHRELKPEAMLSKHFAVVFYATSGYFRHLKLSVTHWR